MLSDIRWRENLAPAKPSNCTRVAGIARICVAGTICRPQINLHSGSIALKPKKIPTILRCWSPAPCLRRGFAVNRLDAVDPPRRWTRGEPYWSELVNQSEAMAEAFKYHWSKVTSAPHTTLVSASPSDWGCSQDTGAWVIICWARRCCGRRLTPQMGETPAMLDTWRISVTASQKCSHGTWQKHKQKLCCRRCIADSPKCKPRHGVMLKAR